MIPHLSSCPLYYEGMSWQDKQDNYFDGIRRRSQHDALWGAVCLIGCFALLIMACAVGPH